MKAALSHVPPPKMVKSAVVEACAPSQKIKRQRSATAKMVMLDRLAVTNVLARGELHVVDMESASLMLRLAPLHANARRTLPVRHAVSHAPKTKMALFAMVMENAISKITWLCANVTKGIQAKIASSESVLRRILCLMPKHLVACVSLATHAAAKRQQVLQVLRVLQIPTLPAFS